MTAKKKLVNEMMSFSDALMSEGNVNGQRVGISMLDDIDSINALSDAQGEALKEAIKQHETRFSCHIEPRNYISFIADAIEH